MPDPAPALATRLLPLYPVLADLPETQRDEGAPRQGFPMVLGGEVCIAPTACLSGRSVACVHGGTTQQPSGLVVPSPDALRSLNTCPMEKT